MGSAGVPYFRLEATNRQFVLAANDFLASTEKEEEKKKVENAVFVMPSEEQVNKKYTKK